MILLAPAPSHCEVRRESSLDCVEKRVVEKAQNSAKTCYLVGKLGIQLLQSDGSWRVWQRRWGRLGVILTASCRIGAGVAKRPFP